MAASGAAVEQAMVIAFDQGVPLSALEARCAQDAAYCSPYATTDASGNFTLTTLVLEGLSGFALWTSTGTDPVLYRYGAFATQGCPADPVVVTLADGYDFYETVTASASATSGGIAWTPALNAGWIAVSTTPVSGDPVTKWMLATADPKAGFAGPVTYGTVPAGAEQTFPVAGSPSAMAEGDTVQVVLRGTAASGFPYVGFATAVVGP